MSQKLFYTGEAIIGAAFELTREKGWGAVSTRNIARELGSSTMPIYSTMKSMEEIERRVRERAVSLLLEYQRRTFTDNAPHNLAIGYVAFARDEKNLFRFLYVDRPVSADLKDSGEQSRELLGQPTADEVTAQLPGQTPLALQDPRVLKSWIFTHGLASLVSTGVLDLPDEEIRDLLAEAGGAFFMFEDRMKRARQTAARGEQGRQR